MYSQSGIIQSNGSLRFNGLGGEPYSKDGKQNGYNAPAQTGVVVFKTNVLNQELLAQCRATIVGYDGTLIQDIALPNAVLTEFPCSVEIVGPPGTSLVLEGWNLQTNGASRGAKKTFIIGEGPSVIAIPLWAESFDTSTACGMTFYSDAAATIPVGIFTGTIPSQGNSIPDGAVRALLSGGEGGFTVFRQR